MDFTPFFAKYEALVAEADAAFRAVAAREPQAVQCAEGCSDCCHALFDLTLIEAIYLNFQFNRLYQGAPRAKILTRADKADRENHLFKRKIFKASEDGVPAVEILNEVARQRIRCPLLNEEDRCDLYAFRPVTCRIYGAPVAIAGEASSCGKSGFQKGGSYPTINMDRLQNRLLMLSQEMVDAMHTKHMRLAEMLAPVSMVLMNTYDREYLGLKEKGCGDSGDSFTWTLGSSQRGAAAADAFGAAPLRQDKEEADGQG
ncbi:YkgJ family cysteine cluster protein [Megalodesulfovibrio gigas]|nr:YkgJ family cysteine cluster protein [Megalodesulfovibrio gigas]